MTKDKLIQKEVAYEDVVDLSLANSTIRAIRVGRRSRSERSAVADDESSKGSQKSVTLTNDGEVLALSEIDLENRRGRVHLLLGPSGCGKSTLLKIVAGLLPADQRRGSRSTAKRVDGPGPERAVVFQDYALFPWMTVEENVEFGLEARGVPLEKRRRFRHDLLQGRRPRRVREEYPHHLSGGMKQRVSIARALAVEPNLF